MNRRGIHGIGLVPPVMMGGNFDEAYLLRDDFTDTLAAGSVNGTLAVPGPGTRTVVDTGFNVSTLLGRIKCVAYVQNGNPFLTYTPTITRAAGRLAVFSAFDEWGAGRFSAGFWDLANPLVPTNALGAWVDFAGLIGCASNGANDFSGNLVSIIGSADTPLAVGLRASGAHYLHKTGGNWHLDFISSVGSTATLYVGWGMRLSSLASLNYIRVPVTLWLPAPLASDGMSSATLTDGLGHAEGVTGGIGAGGANVPWATAATWAVAGGVATNTPVLGAEQNSGALVIGTWYSITATQVNYFYVGCAIGDSFRATATTALDVNNKVKAFATAELFRPLTTSMTADVVAHTKAVAMTARTHSGLAIRLNDPTTPTSGILAFFDKGSVTVVEFNGAIYTQLFTAVKAWAASDSLQLIANGVNVRLFHLTSAGVATLIGSTAVATITTGGYHGLFSTDSGNQLDNFILYPRGTSGEFNILNRWST